MASRVYQAMCQWRTALSQALMADCEGAGQPVAHRAMWCANTRESYCGRCGATAGTGAVTESGCPHCRGQKLAWDGVVRLDAYRQPMDVWVKRMKFARMWKWGPWFGEQLAMAAGEQLNRDQTIVTAVPLHWSRRWSRGYDQAWLMAKAMGRAGGVPAAKLLTRPKRTATQSKLNSHHKRAENVKDAFAMKAVDLSGWTVWLVDDVKTSGSTMTQCCRLLKAAGAERVCLAVAAVADPKGADFQRN